MLERLGHGCRLERRPAGQHFVEHHAQAEDVAAGIDAMALAACLFGAHIRRRAQEARSRAELFFAQRQAEVPDVRLPCGVDQNVRGFYVAMDEPFFVCRLERLRYRGQPLRRLAQRRQRLPQTLREAAAYNQLRYDVRSAVGAAYIVDRNDRWMVQARQDTRFREEGIAVAGHLPHVPRHLERDQPMQFSIFNEVHGPESPLSEHPLNSIAVERIRQQGRRGQRGPLKRGRVERVGAEPGTDLTWECSFERSLLEYSSNVGNFFGKALAILLNFRLLAALQAAFQFDLQKLAEKGDALVAGVGKVVAEVRPRIASPGLLEARAGTVDAPSASNGSGLASSGVMAED